MAGLVPAIYVFLLVPTCSYLFLLGLSKDTDARDEPGTTGLIGRPPHGTGKTLI
jgi:hypothetical protein